jgi:hypothetical protein
MPLRRPSSWLLLAVVALPLAPAARSGPQPAAAPQPPRAQQPQFAGVASCKGCHAQPQLYPDALDLFTMREFPLWDEGDQHSRAFKALSEDLGKQMGERLKAAGHAEYGRPPTEWKECLTCHAIDLALGEANVAAKTFYTDDGVSCEACHGWADKWYARHSNRRIWRELTASAKEADGLYDMRDAHRRAERCSACHVGHAGEGKIVTHEMYAAGHPPLPSLETVTFSMSQPAHFIPPKQAKYFQTEEGQKNAWERYHYRPDELTQTRQVAVGAAVTFRAAVKVLAAEAARSASAPGRPLDFASFDCAACHHDLKVPAWRQVPGGSVPGRPPLSRWPVVLLDVVTRHVGGDPGTSNEMAAKLKALHDAVTARPFGDAKAIAAAAAALDEWTGKALERLQAHKFTADDAEKLLRELAAAAVKPVGPRPVHDYDSARQLAWAFTIVYRDLGRKSEAVDPALAGLDPALDLTFRLRNGEPRKPIAEQLKSRLEIAGAYDPEAFRAVFAKISAALR